MERNSRPGIAAAVTLFAGAVILGIVGTVLLSITADEGGYRLYHPYDMVGLAIDAAAALLLVTSLWRLMHR